MRLLDAHRHAMREFDDRVRAVRDDQWDNDTACAQWTARDLLNHLVAEQYWVPHLLGGATLAEIGDRFDGDLLGSDPLGAWADASARARRAWDSTDAVGEVNVTGGSIPTEDYGWQMTMDLAVHAWDLARGIDAELAIDPALASTVRAVFEPQVEAMQGLGIFDPPQPVPDEAGDQARLLAMLGRVPDTDRG